MLALLPDRGKTMQWAALVVTLITFVLTLHLPATTLTPSRSPWGVSVSSRMHAWIAAPAIRYHLGVDGLSMWLVVLTGFWRRWACWPRGTRSTQRKKLFYVLFLLQQVAMLGIFVSLDLFLYYGVLGAFAGSDDDPDRDLWADGESPQALRSSTFVYAFIPSALLLVGMLWLYAQTGTFDLPTLAAAGGGRTRSAETAAGFGFARWRSCLRLL